MTEKELFQHYCDKHYETTLRSWGTLSEFLIISRRVDFHSKEHLSDWLDEMSEEYLSTECCNVLFEDIRKIASVIAKERNLQ